MNYVVLANINQHDPTFRTALLISDSHGRQGLYGLTRSLSELVAVLETSSLEEFVDNEDIRTYFG